MNIKNFFVQIVIVLTFITVPFILHAQPDDPGDQPEPVPFDGGLTLIIAVSAGYAIKKKYDQRKKEQ